MASKRPTSADTPAFEWAPLAWPDAGSGAEYRVVLHNQDTGRKLTAYEGPETTTPVPAVVRDTVDQWTYEVTATVPGSEDGGHLPVTGPWIIDRPEDDYDAARFDVVSGQYVAGADYYVLEIKKYGAAGRLVRVGRSVPQFLIPAGQLTDGPYRYQITAYVGDQTTPGPWQTIRPRDIAAAVQRAAEARQKRQSLVPDDVEPLPEIVPLPVRTVVADPGAAPERRAALVVLELSLDGLLAETPDGADLVRRQWALDAASPAALALEIVEAADRRAVVLLDVLSGEAFDPARLKRTAEQIARRGHRLELLVRAQPWASWTGGAESSEIPVAAAASAAVDRFTALTGRAPVLARIASDFPGMDKLTAAQGAGLPALMLDAEDMDTLPLWMRGRSEPFLALDGLVAVPPDRIVSTPAHPTDLRLTHEATTADPFLVSNLPAALGALAAQSRVDPVILHLSALDLISRRRVTDEAAATVFNKAAAADARWARAGLTRSRRGYVADAGVHPLMEDLARHAMQALGGGDLPAFDHDRLSLDVVQGWATAMPFGRVAQIDRATGGARTTVARKYDRRLHHALAHSPA